jgi:hypothetical protein
MKCSKTPKDTKKKADTQAAAKTLRVVIEMVRTSAVGPDTHISCIDSSEI